MQQVGGEVCGDDEEDREGGAAAQADPQIQGRQTVRAVGAVLPSRRHLLGGGAVGALVATLYFWTEIQKPITNERRRELCGTGTFEAENLCITGFGFAVWMLGCGVLALCLAVVWWVSRKR